MKTHMQSSEIRP